MLFRSGRGGAGLPGGFTASTGDYLVTLVIGGQTYKTKLHVERVSGSGDDNSPFGESDDASRQTSKSKSK